MRLTLFWVKTPEPIIKVTVLKASNEHRMAIFRSPQGFVKIKLCLSDLISFKDIKW